MTQQTGPFFRLPAEIRNLIYTHLFDNARKDYFFKSPMPSLESCKQFYNEAAPIAYSINEFDLDIHCYYISYLFAPKLTSPKLLPRWLVSSIQHLHIELSMSPYSWADPAIEVVGVEMRLREIILILTRDRCQLSSLHIHCPDWPERKHDDLLGCLCELQVKDRVIITGLRQEAIGTIESLKNVMLIKTPSESAIDRFWSAKERLGICYDLGKYTLTCKTLVNRWLDSRRAATLEALDQAWNKDMRTHYLMSGTESSSAHKSDPADILRRALIRLSELDPILDGNAVSVERISDARKRLYMRPLFLEMKAEEKLHHFSPSKAH